MAFERLAAGVAEASKTIAWPGNIREIRNVLEYAVPSALKTEEMTSEICLRGSDPETGSPLVCS